MGNCVTCITPDTKTHHSNNTTTAKNKKRRPNPYSTTPALIRVLKDVVPLGHHWTRIEDKYVLGRELGRGEFGITYLCTDRDTRENLACKSISKKKLRTAVDVEDVRREVAIMSSLPEHPNVVKLRAAYEDSEAVHLAMELCEGGELFDRIVARGHYSERAAATVVRTVAEVVRMCHDCSVIHRDLKPENFLFANKKENSPLKAIDFGLSVFFRPGEKFSEIVGSPYYMAPEVLKRNYGPEVDVWSDGVILYILLCGVPPFWAETEQGVALAILCGVINFKREPWSQISDNAKSLVRQMLEPDPRKHLIAKQVLEDIGVHYEEKVDYMDLPCPIPYEEIHREALMSLKPELFEGFRFDFTKGLNQKFSLSHSMFMGPTEAPSQSAETIKIPTATYEFGANFIDPKLMLIGRILTDGRLSARVKCDLSDNLTLKANAQLTNEPHMSHGMVNFDYKGKDFRSQVQLGNGALFGASYIQSVTPHFSLGGEVFWAGQHRKSGIGYAARYNTDKMVATGQVASTGMVALSYVQKLSDKVSLASDFMYNYMSRDVTASVGYDYILRQCRLRGKIDSNGCTAAFLEERLNMGLNFILSAEIDHKKKDYKFGFGLTVGE